MAMLCKDQLKEVLKPILRKAERGVIGTAVAEITEELRAECKQARHQELEKLFNSQIVTLKDRGVPEQIVELLSNQKGEVLKKASEMTFGDGHLPFLPVIPRSYRSPYDLMAMVKNGTKAGYTYLNPTQISDVVATPEEPYYIFDIEDGGSTRGKSPEEAEKILKSQKRSPLTASEVMALCVHTDVLSRNYVWATGSRYGSSGRVPVVCLSNGAQPRLTGAASRARVAAGGPRPAVAGRALGFGALGLSVIGLWFSRVFFKRECPTGADRTTVCPFLFAQKMIH